MEIKVQSSQGRDPFEKAHPVQLVMQGGRVGQKFSMTIPEALQLMADLQAQLLLHGKSNPLPADAIQLAEAKARAAAVDEIIESKKVEGAKKMENKCKWCGEECEDRFCSRKCHDYYHLDLIVEANSPEGAK